MKELPDRKVPYHKKFLEFNFSANQKKNCPDSTTFAYLAICPIYVGTVHPKQLYTQLFIFLYESTLSKGSSVVVRKNSMDSIFF